MPTDANPAIQQFLLLSCHISALTILVDKGKSFHRCLVSESPKMYADGGSLLPDWRVDLNKKYKKYNNYCFKWMRLTPHLVCYVLLIIMFLDCVHLVRNERGRVHTLSSCLDTISRSGIGQCTRRGCALYCVFYSIVRLWKAPDTI